MGKITITECDSCEYQQQSHTYDETDVRAIFICGICDEEICEDCQREHAMEHCEWN